MSRYCSNCGTVLADGIAFCDNCGTPVTNEADHGFGAPAASADAQPTVLNDAPMGPIFNAGLPKKAGGMAIASLVLGIISVVTSAFGVGLLFGIAAIVLFAVARKKKDRSGVGLAGMITGIVGTVLSVVVAVVFAIVMAMFSSGALYGSAPAGDGFSGGVDAADPSGGMGFSAERLSEASLVGTWYLSGASVPSPEEGDYRYSVFTYDEAKAIADAGGDAALTFDKNETFVLEYAGTKVTGEWDVDEYHAELDFRGTDNDMFVFFYNNGSEVDPQVDSDFNELAVVDPSSSAVFDFTR